MSSLRRRMLIAATAILPAVFLSLARAQAPRSGSPAGSPAAPPVIRSFHAEGDHWAWIRGVEAESEAWTGGPSGSPRRLSPGITPQEVVLLGADVWVAGMDAGGSGTLVRVDSAGAAAPQVPGLAHPGGLYADNGILYWIDARPAALPGLPFLAAGGPMWRIMARAADGTVRTLCELPGPTAPQPGDILAASGGALLVRMHRVTSTEVFRVPLDGGEPARLLAEEGDQSCRLIAGTLYWTAPSVEATSTVRCIKRLAADGKAELVAEWVPGLGELAEVGGRPAYLSDALYRLSDQVDPPVQERKLPGRVVAAGAQLVAVEGSGAPTLLK